MSASSQEEQRIVDVRALAPPARHAHIMSVFDQLAPGEAVFVVNDHEPVHLVQFMKHERPDFDFASYKAYERRPGEWVGVFRKRVSASGAASAPIVFTSFEKERDFDDRTFSPVPVYTGESYRVILGYLRAGQFIPVHSPKTDLVLLVHSGDGQVVAGDRAFDVRPGDLVIVPKGQKRGVKARSDMEILHLVSPPPTDADHEEVAQKLQLGVFA